MVIGDVAGSLAAASAATAGLLLVFLGNTAAAYDGYTAEQQNSVKARYRQRACEILAGLVLSLVACGLAVLGQAVEHGPTVAYSALALILSLVVVLYAAFKTVWGIS